MLLNFLKQRQQAKQQRRENVEAAKRKMAHNQEMVFQALKQLNMPSNGRAVARKLGWDSSSVTNRLAELTRKGRIKVAFRKKGLDGIWRNFYQVK
jgi:DNA-binding MarR family transcriptional regulator